MLVGPNAIGKTNVMEAVGFLAGLKSFRSVPDSSMVRSGAAEAVVRGEIKRGGSTVLIEVQLPAEGRRRAQVNRQRLSRVADMIGYVRTVAFLPDDLDMVKRGPSHRRDLIDNVCCADVAGGIRRPTRVRPSAAAAELTAPPDRSSHGRGHTRGLG